MSERSRRPAVFRFDDPAVVAAVPVEPASPPEPLAESGGAAGSPWRHYR